MSENQQESIENSAWSGEAQEEASSRCASASCNSYKRKPSTLVPERHTQRDFFIADILDARPKDDTASMEHPLFALRSGDRKVRFYQHGETTVEVRPGIKGLATIHDKDIWIYCISQLMEAINRGRVDVSRTVRFTAYDFMITTNRRTDGDSYKRLGEALERLSESRIITNIETNGKRERSGFGLIDSWQVIERSHSHSNRMIAVEVTLPDWLYRSVTARQVLTLSRDYFRLRKPLDRRIYELARKHCGNQPRWHITIANLHAKSGSQDKLYKFRAAMKALAATNELPDYRMAFSAEKDMITFYTKGAKGSKAEILDLLKA